MITAGVVLAVIALVGGGFRLSRKRKLRRAGEVLEKVAEHAGPPAEKLEDTIRKKRSR